MCLCFRSCDRNDDFIQHQVQQFLAIPIGGGGCRPDTREIVAECADRVALFIGQSARARMLTPLEFRFGLLEFLETFLPFGLETSGDESILRIDSAITTLGPLNAKASTFKITPELRDRALMIGVELFNGGQRGIKG